MFLARLASLPLACVVGCLAVAGLHASDSVPDGWFVWPSVEPAAGSAVDISGLNATPAGRLPRITVRDGRFVTPDGQRIRFWGCNLSAGQAFPATAADADAIARQLAKAGINIARLHHLDNPWGVGSGESIWPADRPTHRELDARQLDKLHRLIATLQAHGIYSNLNLKVSKSLVEADGFPASVTQVWSFQKRVDMFDRRMIDLQKDYARRLLTTKNPYTGLAPAEDPAIAVIELNNENSVFGFWTRDLGRGLDKMAGPFRQELQAQWNEWLSRRYPDDATLARAWAPAATTAGASLLPANAGWKLVLAGGAAGDLRPGPDASMLAIETKTAGLDWHVQASLHDLALADGCVYTVEFLARADHPRRLGVGVGIDALARPNDPWRSFGLLDSAEIGPDWQPVRFSFPAHSVAGTPASLNFNAGQAVGLVSIKDLRLVADAPGAGLQPGQSLAAKSVPIPVAPSTAQWADWIHFLADTDRAFADEMRAFLKNELHVRAPIVCSQIDYGGIAGMNREQAMDFADGHSYWQHPVFTGTASWDPEHWTIINSPQLAEFGDRAFGEFGNLAMVRVAGKPFTVSEYDHPAPSEFVCEMYPTLASFACRQNWDIVYPFCIGAYDATNADGAIKDFFDQLHHPAKWGQSPFAALVFRQGLVAPAAAEAELHLGSPLWAEQPHADVLWRQLIPDRALDFLNTRYAVSDRPGAAGSRARVTRSAGEAGTAAPVTLITAPQGRVYVIAAERAAAAVGFLGGGSVDAGALHVCVARFGRDFASVTAVALDAKPLRTSARVLVTVVARAGNQGLVWNESRTSVGAAWGHGPTIAERVPATITLDGLAGRKVYPLAPDGTRAAPVPSADQSGALTFSVGPNDRTIHYEITSR